MDTLLALRSFHAGERRVFERLLNLGKDPYVAKKIMALWLWLESVGHHDLLQKIQSRSDRFLSLIAAEAETCLACLQNTLRPSAANDDIPITAGIAEQPITLADFELHREIAVRGISHILNGVCAMVFDDIIVIRRGMAEANQMMAQLRPFGEGSSRHLADPLGGPHLGHNPWGGPSSSATVPWPPLLLLGHTSEGQGPDAPVVRSSSHMRSEPPTVWSDLNPMARPWTPEPDPTPEDERCLFVTFSRGYPLTRGEIMDFFTQNWGDCVENVYVESSTAREGPLYGRVIFNARSMISLVLNGVEKVKFSVNGKPLWARMYRPRRVGS